MAVGFALLPVIIFTVILAALFRRRMIVAIPLGLIAAIAGLAVSRMFGWTGGGFSLAAVMVVAVGTLVGVLISPRKSTSPPGAAEGTYETAQGSETAEQAVEIDEVAFQQWLEARGLTKTNLTPERLLDLRRQFAGLA